MVYGEQSSTNSEGAGTNTAHRAAGRRPRTRYLRLFRIFKNTQYLLKHLELENAGTVTHGDIHMKAGTREWDVQRARARRTNRLQITQPPGPKAALLVLGAEQQTWVPPMPGTGAGPRSGCTEPQEGEVN